MSNIYLYINPLYDIKESTIFGEGDLDFIPFVYLMDPNFNKKIPKIDEVFFAYSDKMVHQKSYIKFISQDVFFDDGKTIIKTVGRKTDSISGCEKKLVEIHSLTNLYKVNIWVSVFKLSDALMMICDNELKYIHMTSFDEFKYIKQYIYNSTFVVRDGIDFCLESQYKMSKIDFDLWGFDSDITYRKKVHLYNIYHILTSNYQPLINTNIIAVDFDTLRNIETSGKFNKNYAYVDNQNIFIDNKRLDKFIQEKHDNERKLSSIKLELSRLEQEINHIRNSENADYMKRMENEIICLKDELDFYNDLQNINYSINLKIAIPNIDAIFAIRKSIDMELYPDKKQLIAFVILPKDAQDQISNDCKEYKISNLGIGGLYLKKDLNSIQNNSIKDYLKSKGVRRILYTDRDVFNKIQTRELKSMNDFNRLICDAQSIAWSPSSGFNFKKFANKLSAIDFDLIIQTDWSVDGYGLFDETSLYLDPDGASEKVSFNTKGLNFLAYTQEFQLGGKTRRLINIIGDDAVFYKYIYGLKVKISHYLLGHCGCHKGGGGGLCCYAFVLYEQLLTQLAKEEANIIFSDNYIHGFYKNDHTKIVLRCCDGFDTTAADILSMGIQPCNRNKSIYGDYISYIFGNDGKRPVTRRGLLAEIILSEPE